MGSSHDEPSAIAPTESEAPRLEPSFGTSLKEVLAPLIGLLQRSRAAMLAAAPTLIEVARRFARAQQSLDYWEQHAPQILKDAISAEGLIVPISQMSFGDVLELSELHRRRGSTAVVDRIRQHYDELFGGPAFLEILRSEWGGDAHMARRLHLLSQALDAHKVGMYAVSVPALLAQFEGLIVDIMGHTGRLNFGELRRYVTGLEDAERLPKHVLSSFVNDVVLTMFAHGDQVPPFSRHAILHGGDVDYATETNSRTAILLIDSLRQA